MKDIHIYETCSCAQGHAIQEFNTIRRYLEEMHNAKIQVIKMYKPLGIACDYRVKYKLIKESEQE